MPAATDQFPDLGQLNNDIKALAHQFDVLAEQFLEKCKVMGQGVRWARSKVDADLRQGVEARQLTRALASFKEYSSDVLEVYCHVKEVLAGRKGRAKDLAPLIQEAEEFVAWLDDLLARLNRWAPPPDEGMLRERARQCDEANAWVNFDDALAGLRKGGG
jgi:hypothetical protein